MTPQPLPGFPEPSRRSTPAEVREECERIIRMLERQQAARRDAGGTW